MLNRFSFIFIVMLLSNSLSLHAQENMPDFSKLAQKALKTFHVAGFAMAVVKDGELIHCEGYGVQNIQNQQPVTAETNFAIASNSKAFTTAALAILVDEGKLNWNDKVIDYLPSFRMYNSYVTENFNIKDLLTHRSGLGLGAGDLIFIPDGGDFTAEDLLPIFQHFKPVSAFRTQFDYDNLLYLVAGELIKKVSGKSWEKFVTEKIFRPLGMHHTFASVHKVESSRLLATPYAHQNKDLQELSHIQKRINGAAGGIYSNVKDLSQWLLVQLNNGKYGAKNAKQLFSEKQQQEMWTIHTVLDADKNPRYNSHFSGYGLGWKLSDVKGNMAVEHTGSLPGMLSKTLLIPDLDFGIVVLTNTSDEGQGVYEAITRSIADYYLSLPSYDWFTHYAEKLQAKLEVGDKITEQVWQQVSENTEASYSLQTYVGSYEDAWFGKIEIFKQDNVLRIRSLRSPKLNGRMYFYEKDVFAVRWEYRDLNCDAFARFSNYKNHHPQLLKLEGISPNIDFSFDFHDLHLVRTSP